MNLKRYYLITNIPIIIEYLLARMMPYVPVTNPEITFSLGLTKMFFIK